MALFITPDSEGHCCECQQVDCGGCNTCTVTYETRSVAYAKCGYLGPATGIFLYPHGLAYDAILSFAASNCPAPSGYVAGTASLWYHKSQNCYASYDGWLYYGAGADGALFSLDCSGEDYSGGDTLLTSALGACTDLSFLLGSDGEDGGLFYWSAAFVLGGTGDVGPINNQFSTDPSSCAESPLGNLQDRPEVDTLTGVTYSTSDCSGAPLGDYMCFYGGVNGDECPPYTGSSLTVTCSQEWANQYLWDRYTDQEAAGNARTELNAMDFASAGSGAMASISFSAPGGGGDYGDVNITDLQYTLTPSIGGDMCYWTVRFTDASGSHTDTAMSGTGTFTITPDTMGTLNYDGNGDYSSGEGTWEIINVSGRPPS